MLLILFFNFGLNLTDIAAQRGQCLLCKAPTPLTFKDPSMMLLKTTGPTILRGVSSVVQHNNLVQLKDLEPKETTPTQYLLIVDIRSKIEFRVL